jgi:hypothetical protein
LVLHIHAGGTIVFEDLAPCVEQIDNSILNAAQSFFPFGFIRKWPLSYPFKKTIKKSALEHTDARLQRNARGCDGLHSLKFD